MSQGIPTNKRRKRRSAIDVGCYLAAQNIPRLLQQASLHLALSSWRILMAGLHVKRFQKYRVVPSRTSQYTARPLETNYIWDGYGAKWYTHAFPGHAIPTSALFLLAPKVVLLSDKPSLPFRSTNTRHHHPPAMGLFHLDVEKILFSAKCSGTSIIQSSFVIAMSHG